MSKGITSTEGLIRKVFNLPADSAKAVFYRGHSCKEKYKLEPALFRVQSHLDQEDVMFREMLVSNPADFSQDTTTLDKLVRMQHHSLPTRLLDITSNPLMALYFACKSNKERTGQIIVFRINRENVRFFDSDTASCIANLSRMQKQDKANLDFKKDLAAFNETLPAKKLLHYIREEKPFFEPKIRPDDLKRIVCVRSRMNNLRIQSQSGAFLLFGIGASLPEAGTAEIQVERIDISAKEKDKILQELDKLNINDSTAFPYIENTATYIKEKYR